MLVYSISLSAGQRHDTAKEIVARAALGPCCLTLQSVSEFYAVVTRKRRMSPAEAVPVTEAMLEVFPTVLPTIAAVRSALRSASSGRASYPDALLLHTAAEAGCTAILSEDLADGTTLAGIRIINPFAGDSLSPAAEALLVPAE